MERMRRAMVSQSALLWQCKAITISEAGTNTNWRTWAPCPHTVLMRCFLRVGRQDAGSGTAGAASGATTTPSVTEGCPAAGGVGFAGGVFGAGSSGSAGSADACRTGSIGFERPSGCDVVDGDSGDGRY